MAELQGEYLVKTQEDLLTTLESRLLAVLPNAYVGDDSIFKILLEIFASQVESVFVANQLVLEDLFIQTASVNAVEKWGTQFGLDRKLGNVATGNVKFAGTGGTFIPEGTEISTDNPLGDPLYFLTSADATIPNPGTPTACTAASGGAGAITGDVTYLVVFYTAEGETLPGPPSNTLTASSNDVDLTNIPVGGTGTVGRYIYRDKDGSGFKRLTDIANNVDTTYTDNDNSVGSTDTVSLSTAEAISVAAAGEDSGEDYNVTAGEISQLVDAPAGVVTVTNDASFTGGSNPEDIEEYRSRLLDFVASPKSGSPTDLEIWAEEIDGVETATAFTNDNEGTPTNGHATVRVAGPDGAVPSTAVQDEVLAYLQEKDFANITLHVTTFTQNSEDVTVSLTLESGYVLADVQTTVEEAIKTYINGLGVGETLYIAGIFDAVFGIPGVATLTVSVPATDQTQTSTQKAIPGTISVS